MDEEDMEEDEMLQSGGKGGKSVSRARLGKGGGGSGSRKKRRRGKSGGGGGGGMGGADNCGYEEEDIPFDVLEAVVNEGADTPAAYRRFDERSSSRHRGVGGGGASAARGDTAGVLPAPIAVEIPSGGGRVVHLLPSLEGGGTWRLTRRACEQSFRLGQMLRVLQREMVLLRMEERGGLVVAVSGAPPPHGAGRWLDPNPHFLRMTMTQLLSTQKHMQQLPWSCQLGLLLSRWCSRKLPSNPHSGMSHRVQPIVCLHMLLRHLRGARE